MRALFSEQRDDQKAEEDKNDEEAGEHNGDGQSGGHAFAGQFQQQRAQHRAKDDRGYKDKNYLVKLVDQEDANANGKDGEGQTNDLAEEVGLVGLFEWGSGCIWCVHMMYELYVCVDCGGCSASRCWKVMDFAACTRPEAFHWAGGRVIYSGIVERFTPDFDPHDPDCVGAGGVFRSVGRITPILREQGLIYMKSPGLCPACNAWILLCVHGVSNLKSDDIFYIIAQMFYYLKQATGERD
jgi:hypothetical protein